MSTQTSQATTQATTQAFGRRNQAKQTRYQTKAPKKQYRPPTNEEISDFLKTNSRAYHAYVNALNSSKRWAAQGKEQWSCDWESYAKAIAFRMDDWESVRIPDCKH